jgi:hypothetical protein
MPLDTDAAAVAGDVMREKCEASSRILARQTVYGLPVVDSWPRPSRANRLGPIMSWKLSSQVTRDDVMLMVTQYRPTIEEDTLEFPSGTVDLGESQRKRRAAKFLKRPVMPSPT